MNRAVTHFGFGILAAMLAVATGCQMPAFHATQAVSPEPAPESVRIADPTASPADVSMLGAHPGGRFVAAESRLLTNLTRHTFSSVGRDFDPDLLSDGQTLLFASTRNSEHPDVFIKHVDGYAITQLTSDPADDIQPRFSPDGQNVVFCSNRTGNWDIWLISREGTGLTQLTRTNDDEVAPCFSPDGSQVAFTVWSKRSRQWEIWVLSVEEPGVRRLLCYGMFPDWSPDGNKIAFQRARQRGTRWFSVWTVDIVDNEARHPTELAYTDAAACIAPRWSPDGERIVFCTVAQNPQLPAESRNVVADVWVVDSEIGTRTKLTDGAEPAFNPAWSPDGRVYFVSARAGVENIWSQDSGLGDFMAASAGPASAGAITPGANRPLATIGDN